MMPIEFAIVLMRAAAFTGAVVFAVRCAIIVARALQEPIW